MATKYQRTPEADSLLVEYLHGIEKAGASILDLTKSPFPFLGASEVVQQELVFLLRSHTKLESVNLSQTKASQTIISAIAASASFLTHLTLSNVQLDSAALREISQILDSPRTTLTYLDISVRPALAILRVLKRQENPDVGPKSFLAQSLMNNSSLKELRASNTGLPLFSSCF